MIDDSSKARGLIAGVIAIGIVSLAGALFFFTPSSASQAILNGLLSALTLALGSVIQFYFGSSSGAKTLVASQNQTVETLAKAVSTSTPGNDRDDADIPIDPTLAALKGAGVDQKALNVALAALRASK